MGRYILSVIAAAMVMGILSGILDKKSSAAGLLRLVGGLFLTFTLLQPLTKMDFSRISDYVGAFAADGSSLATEGQDLAAEEMETIIKSQVEAYILDKAEAYSLDLDVEVTLSDDETPVPVEARLRGDISPYAKRQLQQMMEEDLGIRGENQIWIG